MKQTGLSQALDLRQGEVRKVAVMAAFLFLNTANTTVLSAAKNGLFLSVYPGRLIPQAVIAASALTALVALVFTGIISGTARRSLASWLTAGLGLSLVVGRIAFEVEPRASFALYLWLSVVQVLIITHAWDYVGDMLTGRQAKRILPLVGMGASIGAIAGGTSVAPAALSIGTANLLVVATVLLFAALPFLWAVPEPGREEDESETVDLGAVRNFVRGAGRGFHTVAGEPLVRLLAVALVALTLTGTLVDLQLKFALQDSFDRDRITAFYGVMSAVVGAGTLLLQFWAARFIFPKMGVSFAALLQAGALSIASGGVAVLGGVLALAGLQALDDILQFSLQKPVEQVSLLPFPGAKKSAVLATFGGVLRPASKAAAGGLVLLLVGRQELLPLATVLSATVAFVAYTRHRQRYLAALEGALVRHAVDFQVDTPLVVDREALSVIDRALQDRDPTVVVFAVSLLAQLPETDALERALPLLEHRTPEVRAEAARVLARVDLSEESQLWSALRARLDEETSPFVLSALLNTTGGLEGCDPSEVLGFLEHEDRRVRREALVALGRLGWPDIRETLWGDLTSGDSEKHQAASLAVGDLGLTELLDYVACGVEDTGTRSAAMEAMSALGAAAVPALLELLQRRDLPLPCRRGVVTALAAIEAPTAREALLQIIDEPALGSAAVTSLHRMRQSGNLDPVDPERTRTILEVELRTGLRHALVAAAIRGSGDDDRARFVADELDGLRLRSVYRVIRILALSHDPGRLSVIELGLGADGIAERSNALELLEGTLSPDLARVVMPYAEAMTEGFPLKRASDYLADAAALLEHPLETLEAESDWWPRALALHALSRDDEITTPGRDPDALDEDATMIPLIERVMILKGSQLFKHFPGNDLAGIASLAKVVHLAEDEVVFEQGDVGDAFYMVVHGAIRIMRGSTELALLGSREGFGEMAILDQETRSATATAAEPTTLLRIDRHSFDRLIEQNPAVARGIYRVLTERLRNTLAQVAAG